MARRLKTIAHYEAEEFEALASGDIEMDRFTLREISEWLTPEQKKDVEHWINLYGIDGALNQIEMMGWDVKPKPKEVEVVVEYNSDEDIHNIYDLLTNANLKVVSIAPVLTEEWKERMIGKYGAEEFEARENKDGTVVLSDAEWNRCKLLHNGNYLWYNDELKHIGGIKSGNKFEKVRSYYGEALGLVHKYEKALKEQRRKLMGWHRKQLREYGIRRGRNRVNDKTIYYGSEEFEANYDWGNNLDYFDTIYDAEEFGAESGEIIYFIKQMDEDNEKGYFVGNEQYIRDSLNESYYHTMDRYYDDEEKYQKMLNSYETMSVAEICEELGLELVGAKSNGGYLTITGDDMKNYFHAEEFGAEYDWRGWDESGRNTVKKYQRFGWDIVKTEYWKHPEDSTKESYYEVRKIMEDGTQIDEEITYTKNVFGEGYMWRGYEFGNLKSVLSFIDEKTEMLRKEHGAESFQSETQATVISSLVSLGALGVGILLGKKLFFDEKVLG